MADQQARQSSLSIALGSVQKVLLSIDSLEHFSKPFEIKIDMLSQLGEVDLLPHLGRPAVVTIKEDNELLRHFHGILVDSELIAGNDDHSAVYRLTLRPKAWLHEQGRNFRIFQNKSVREIMQKILDDRGIKTDWDRLEGGKRMRTYCVQYGESDFGFVCRLMEEEGIYYYYRHTEENHFLVLCDSPAAHKPGKVPSFEYQPMSATVFNVDSLSRFASSGAYIQDWREYVTTGGEAQATLSDFDFLKPGRSMVVAAKDQPDHPGDEIEVYTYPGRFYIESEGEALSETALQARRANRRSFRGASRNGALAVGERFTLTDHDQGRFNTEYVLTHCRHSISGEAHRSNGGGGGGGSHIVHFVAIPAQTKWKVPLTRRRPIVPGPETAIVTGPATKPGAVPEEIYCDKYGRVKVQFHWDRDGKKDENSSCYIRVGQIGHLGSMLLPRIGHEVVVHFINGDPDRPLIVGRVYNETEQPRYPLDANKTRAVWRSKTYKEMKPSGAKKMVGKCDPGYNEISFEDKAGEEEILTQAQRDLNTRIQRNETWHVGGDQEIDIGDNRKLTIGTDDKVEVIDNRETKIGKQENRDVGGDRITEITGNEKLHVVQNMTVTVDGEILIESGKKITLKVGDSTITIDKSEIRLKSKQIQAEGETFAGLKTGGNFINTNPSGAAVKGTMVLINSGGSSI